VKVSGGCGDIKGCGLGNGALWAWSPNDAYFDSSKSKSKLYSVSPIFRCIHLNYIYFKAVTIQRHSAQDPVTVTQTSRIAQIVWVYSGARMSTEMKGIACRGT
jgi:hypothetical protein